MCTTSAVWLSVVLSSRYFTEIHRRTSHPSHQLECFRWRVSSLLEPLHTIVSWCLPFPYPQLSWISIMLFGWRNPTTCSGLKISVSKVTRFFPQNSRNCSLSSHDTIYSVVCRSTKTTLTTPYWLLLREYNIFSFCTYYTRGLWWQRWRVSEGSTIYVSIAVCVDERKLNLSLVRTFIRNHPSELI
jgi:hypothetical protein